jgi:hypothetical protein
MDTRLMSYIVRSMCHYKRPPRKKRAERRSTELVAVLDAMMREALNAALREPTSEPLSRRRRVRGNPLALRKKIQIYSAGCRLCQEAEATIRRIVGLNHDIEVLEMRRVHVAQQAARLGIQSVPGVVVDGQLCGTGGGLDEAALRSAIAALPPEKDE